MVRLFLDLVQGPSFLGHKYVPWSQNRTKGTISQWWTQRVGWKCIPATSLFQYRICEPICLYLSRKSVLFKKIEFGKSDLQKKILAMNKTMIVRQFRVLTLPSKHFRSATAILLASKSPIGLETNFQQKKFPFIGTIIYLVTMISHSAVDQLTYFFY